MKRILSGKLLVGVVLIGAGLGIAGLAASRVYDILTAPPTCYGQAGLPAEGTWTTGQPTTLVRSETAAAALDGRIYVAGGLVGGWLATNAAEMFDPALNRWQPIAPMPLAIHHAGVAAAGSKLYVLGGYDDIGKMVRAEPDIAASWAYNPATDAWEEIAPMPVPRSAGATVVWDGRIFLLGGTGEAAADVWVYDPATDTWDTSRQGKIPTLREHVPAIELDGRMYVIGGRWKDISTGAVESYDPQTDTWATHADLPTPRSALSLAVFDGRIHAVGGEDLDTGCTYGVHEVYDPATDTWSEMAGIPTPRHAMESTIIDGRWYLIGGAEQSGAYTERSLTGLVQIFTPDSAAAGS